MPPSSRWKGACRMDSRTVGNSSTLTGLYFLVIGLFLEGAQESSHKNIEASIDSRPLEG